jgi:hypothetical protein
MTMATASPSDDVGDTGASVRASAGGVARGDCITVLRRPERQPAGKVFERRPDGRITKQSVGAVGIYTAKTVHVPDVPSFARVLCWATKEPSACLMLSTIDDAPLPCVRGGWSTPLKVLSTSRLAREAGLPGAETRHVMGRYLVRDGAGAGGKVIPAFARLKAQVRPSRWLLLDKDVKDDTPTDWRISVEAWRARLAKALPGLDGSGHIVLPSSSGRVMLDGRPAMGAVLGAHVFVKLSDPPNTDELTELRDRISTALAERGWAWRVEMPVKYASGQETVRVGTGWPLDLATFSPERLVFEARPGVWGAGLSVAPARITSTNGPGWAWKDLLPPAGARAGRTEACTNSRAGGDGWPREGTLGLTWETLVVPEYDAPDLPGTAGCPVPFARFVAQRPPGTADRFMRMQTPFRAGSTSFAAFLRYDRDGEPVLHDSGTPGERYRLPPPIPIGAALRALDEARTFEGEAENPSACLEVVRALRAMGLARRMGVPPGLEAKPRPNQKRNEPSA